MKCGSLSLMTQQAALLDLTIHWPCSVILCCLTFVAELLSFQLGVPWCLTSKVLKHSTLDAKVVRSDASVNHLTLNTALTLAVYISSQDFKGLYKNGNCAVIVLGILFPDWSTSMTSTSLYSCSWPQYWGWGTTRSPQRREKKPSFIEFTAPSLLTVECSCLSLAPIVLSIIGHLQLCWDEL